MCLECDLALIVTVLKMEETRKHVNDLIHNDNIELYKKIEKHQSVVQHLYSLSRVFILMHLN